MQKTRKLTNKLIEQKHGYLIHNGSDKADKGTVVNWPLPFLHGGLLSLSFL